MIVNAILQLVEVTLNFFFGLLPDITFPSWLTSTPIPSGVASAIGGFMNTLGQYVPVNSMLGALADVLALWPVVAAYVLFSWVWQHIPTVAGFGTGDG